jgi:hypothetical protein
MPCRKQLVSAWDKRAFRPQQYCASPVGISEGFSAQPCEPPLAQPASGTLERLTAGAGAGTRAASFQDLTGQRIRRAISNLQQVETMLGGSIDHSATAAPTEPIHPHMPDATGDDHRSDGDRPAVERLIEPPAGSNAVFCRCDSGHAAIAPGRLRGVIGAAWSGSCPGARPMNSLKMTMLAAVAGVTLGAVQAHAQAMANESTSPMWWGTAGNHADLLVSYDSAAKSPLVVWGAYEQGIDKSAVSQGLVYCGTAQPNGSTVIQPGGYCVIRGFRTGGAIIARFVATDNSNNTANFQPYIHAALEMRDANDNTLQRAELR